MIELRSEIPREVEWSRVQEWDDEDVARFFLHAERSLASIENDRDLLRSLAEFLSEAADRPLLILRGQEGQLLVQASGVDAFVLVTGRTAGVLRAYLDGDVVTPEELLDMTVRRRQSREH